MKKITVQRLSALAAACACALTAIWLSPSPQRPDRAAAAPSLSPPSPSAGGAPPAARSPFAGAPVYAGAASPEPRNPAQAKLGRGQLLQAVQWFAQRHRASDTADAQTAAQIAALERVGLPPSARDGANVQVSIGLALAHDDIADPAKLADAAQALGRRLSDAGLSAQTVPGSPMLHAAVPLARLEWVAGLKGVAAVRLAPKVTLASLVSEGVAESRTDVLRALGQNERVPDRVRGTLDGKGLTVAVIDAFAASNIAELREAGEWPTAENTVEIPANGHLFGSTEQRHGNAVTEIVYDIAPGANYRLYDVGDLNSKYPGAALVNWIRAIQDAAHLDLNNQRLGPPRAQIINASMDEIGNSPGDGTPGDGEARGLYEAIEAARANGVLTVVAAGNSADNHWDGQSTAGDGAQVAQDFGSDNPDAANARVPDEINILRLPSMLRVGERSTRTVSRSSSAVSLRAYGSSNSTWPGAIGRRVGPTRPATIVWNWCAGATPRSATTTACRP
ncbi:hypothetical protein J5226_06645 [Lysobacter sp. K5869]|uniref:S8 family serine peptidase n=1 Tax=Lysobacter sp. K5869 TaxID=2820808 RepID=UPI001C063502|nr:S8 family serine peptidase [Lysobacter sp. K5869]QWP78069.1 hypothetical protein J5226_06645 [Lysobacter sp. K5869]